MDRIVLVLLISCLFAQVDGCFRLWMGDCDVWGFVRDIAFFCMALGLFEIWRIL